MLSARRRAAKEAEHTTDRVRTAYVEKARATSWSAASLAGASERALDHPLLSRDLEGARIDDASDIMLDSIGDDALLEETLDAL